MHRAPDLRRLAQAATCAALALAAAAFTLGGALCAVVS